MDGLKWSYFLLSFIFSITAICCQPESQVKHQNSVDDNHLALPENVLLEISQLRNQLNQVQAENEVLKSDFVKETHLSNLRISSLQNQHQTLNNDMEVLKEENQNLKDKISDITDSMSRDMKGNSQNENVFINFRAYASEDRVYQDGDIVMFDAVDVNEGNHYIVEDSTFVCPYTGEYMFMFTQLTQSGKVMRSDLLQEGSHLHSLFGRDIDHGVQSTAVVVTHCISGQRVWVEARILESEDEGYMYGGPTIDTSFAGFLLRVNTSHP